MADDEGVAPSLHVENFSHTMRGETSGRLHCNVYADDVRIAKLHCSGDGTVAVLEFPGNFDSVSFFPENLVQLARVLHPKETEGRSDQEVLEVAEIFAQVATFRRPGSHVGFDPASGEGAEEYREALAGHVHGYSLEVQIGQARREISYSPWSADLGSGDRVGDGHTTTRPFHWRTVKLLKERYVWRSGPGDGEDCKGPSKRDLHRRYRFKSFRLDRRCLGSPDKDVIHSGTYFIEHGARHPWSERAMELFRALSVNRVVDRVGSAQLVAQIAAATTSMISQRRVVGGSQLR